MVEKRTIENNIEKIVDENLNEKYEDVVQDIKHCKECRYYDKVWIWGSNLHICSHNSDEPSTSRDAKKLYDECPIDHKISYKKGYIKKYGIIHQKPRNEWDSGAIKVVDFTPTHFEDDGYNPDVSWNNVVIFFYTNEEEKEQMMKLAYEYYTNFNLEADWVEKRCYG